MSWSQTCQPYQPLPISTGTIGYDRCGNVEVYAAPATVKAPVGWGCWPIQNQQQGWPPGPAWGGGTPSYPGYPGGPGLWWWWLAWSGVDPGFSAPPWWGANWPWPVPGNSNAARAGTRGGGSIGQAAQASGAARASWAIDVRDTMRRMPR